MTPFQKLTEFGRHRRPCIFILDYDLANPLVLPLDELDPAQIRFDFHGNSNGDGSFPPSAGIIEPIGISAVRPPAYRLYRQAFQQVRQAFVDGYSYLLNLCAASDVEFRGSLADLFQAVRAPYRLLVRGEKGNGSGGFLVFSPESFIRVEGNRIAAFPMKGSLKCSPREVASARQSLLDNAKELAEHVTIVDLIRNDLGRVAESITVERFRYLEEIRLPESVLLQTSSEISGRLPLDWPDRLGEILAELLPAGSITGAPKTSTRQVITQAEMTLGGPRGFYCGVCGIFDSANLDSAVMIRFLEDHGPVAGTNADAALRRGKFRSGGGLTIYSRPQAEYRELVAKIALPIPPLLMETIRIEAGRAWNIEGHRSRIQAGLVACYGNAGAKLGWSLDEELAAAVAAVTARGGQGRWRCRLVYRDNLAQWTVEPYVLRRPQRLYAVVADGLEYSHKYADRRKIDALRESVAAKIGNIGMDWDILLVRDGLVLETSYSAIVVRAGQAWLTPAAPLLPSTGLAALVADAAAPEIRRADIKLTDLVGFSEIHLVNAMIGWADGVAVSDIRVLQSPA